MFYNQRQLIFKHSQPFKKTLYVRNKNRSLKELIINNFSVEEFTMNRLRT